MGRETNHAAVYAAVYEDIRRKIFSGELQPGTLLPSESQLCAEYSASRETIRKGLKQLSSEGLIYSKPKVGCFVSTPNHSVFSLRLPEESEPYTAHYCDIHGISADAELQQLLDIPEGSKIIELSQITQSEDGTPVAYEVKYVPYERAYPSVEGEIRYAVLPDVTFSKLASFEYYTEVTVKAVNADAAAARALCCRESEALLLIEQLFIRQDGKKFAFSRGYCRQPYGQMTGTSGSKI